ncbi:MFS transporter [Streptomyces sp. NPDC002156]
MIGFVIGLYFSHGVLAVFVLNAMMALSSSSFGPVGKALLSDLLPPERRVKTFSYQYMAINMGFAVGPVVGAAGYGVYLVGLAGILLEGVHGRISSLLAQHLSDGFADGTVILGYVLTTNAVTVVALQLFVSRFVERRNPVTAIVVGGLLTVVGMAGFAFSEEIWHFVVAMVVFSLGEILIYPAEFAIIDRIAPEARRGSYFGAQTFAQLGVFVGPFTGGLLLAAYDGTTMFLGVGCFALAGVVIYLLVGRRNGYPAWAPPGRTARWSGRRRNTPMKWRERALRLRVLPNLRAQRSRGRLRLGGLIEESVIAVRGAEPVRVRAAGGTRHVGLDPPGPSRLNRLGGGRRSVHRGRGEHCRNRRDGLLARLHHRRSRDTGPRSLYGRSAIVHAASHGATWPRRRRSHG